MYVVPCRKEPNSFIGMSFCLLFQVDRGVKSPADISMDISRLVQTLKIHPVSFKDGVRSTFATEARQ